MSATGFRQRKSPGSNPRAFSFFCFGLSCPTLPSRKSAAHGVFSTEKGGGRFLFRCRLCGMRCPPRATVLDAAVQKLSGAFPFLFPPVAPVSPGHKFRKGMRITQRAVPKGEHGSVLYPTMAAIRCCAKQIALSAKHRAKQASAAACEGARNGGGACRRPNSLEKTSSPFLRRKDMRSPICGIFPGDWAYHEPTWPGMGFFLPFPGG